MTKSTERNAMPDPTPPGPPREGDEMSLRSAVQDAIGSPGRLPDSTIERVIAVVRAATTARLAATMGAEVRAKLERVGQEIGVYGVQTSVTGDLAPHSDLTDALRAVEHAVAALRQRAKEAEQKYQVEHAHRLEDLEDQFKALERAESADAALTQARRAAREELLSAEPSGPWEVGRHAEPKKWGGEVTWSVSYQNWTYGPFLVKREARAVANALNTIRALPDVSAPSIEEEI